MIILGGLIAVLGIVYWSCLSWRRSIKLVIYLIVLEGAIRKWILPQASDLIYFLKDVILLGAYISYFFSCKPIAQTYINTYFLKILIFLVTGWCFFQSLNSSLGSLLIGALGLKAYLFYIPLMWMSPNLFQSKEELQKFLRNYLILTIPIGILGVFQFFSPASSPLNAYANEEAGGVATFGVTSFARITGTFSYIGGYATYLMIALSLLVPILSLEKSRRWQIIYTIEIFFVTVNSFMTGTRGVIFTQILFLGAYLILLGFTQPGRTIRLLQRFAVPIIIVSLAALFWFSSAIDAFLLRTTANQDIGGRFELILEEPIDFFQYKQFDGYGTGATQSANAKLRRTLGLPTGEVIPVGYESELGRIVLELGPLGFILWYILKFTIMFYLFKVFWKLKSPFLRQLALSLFLIHGTQLTAHLVFNHTFSVYYWFFSGFIFLLPKLEKTENLQKQHQRIMKNVSSAYFSDPSYRQS